MHSDQPSDLNNYSGEMLFHLRAKKPDKTIPAISPRLKLLERILSEISQSDLPAKDHFAEHMRHRYRRNCKLSTLRNTAASMKHFLSFYQETGKQHIEQMTREDIEAFTEDLQDRGLKPNTVSCRLRIIYAFIRSLIEDKVIGYELLERKIRISYSTE